jgi:predicted phosphate transport protein (TIGR00153 family)
VARFILTPRDTRFYDMFEQDTDNLVVAARALVDMFQEGCPDRAARAEQIKAYEEHGDSIPPEIITRLHRSFVTPIDREDIATLAHTLDSVMDFVEAAARTLVLYRMSEPTPRAKELAQIVLNVAVRLHEVMPSLRDRKQFARILRACVDINRLENQADAVHHAAQAELFESCPNAIDVIKWRELYQHLENATDLGEDVANALEGIVLKHA